MYDEGLRLIPLDEELPELFPKVQRQFDIEICKLESQSARSDKPENLVGRAQNITRELGAFGLEVGGAALGAIDKVLSWGTK